MLLSPEFESIKSIPGVVPEHPYQYFRERNKLDWDRYMEANGMFTFSFGRINQNLEFIICDFQRRCIGIQMAPSSEEAQDLRTSLDELLVSITENATQMRSDEMEYALMQKEFAQAQLDAALSYTYVECGKTKHNYYNILRGAINLIHITGWESTPETLRDILWDDMYEKMKQNTQDVHISFNSSHFREEFGKHLRLLANNALSDARNDQIMTDAQAKIISFYLTEWDTSDLRSLTSGWLEGSKVFEGGVRLTTSEIKTLYPLDREPAV